MWKKLFSWRDFWPFPICLVMGVLFLLAGKEGSPLKLLLGIASLAYTLYDLAKQLISRISILRSPDYPAMEKDLSDARSFLGGRILLGKDWLFSSYSGKIYPCKAVRDLQQKVSRPPRGSATAKLTARVPGEGEVVLAAYTYEEANIRQANALAQELDRRRKPAEVSGAEAAVPASPADPPQAQAAPERQEEQSAGRKPVSAPEESSQKDLPPADARSPGEVCGPEAAPAEQTDTPAPGSGERFEDYVCTIRTPLGVYLFTAFLLSLFPLFIAVSCCVIAGRGWLAIPVSAAIFFILWSILKMRDRSRENSSRERIRAYFNAPDMQTDFEQALRNNSDTIRLGERALYVRGLGLPIRCESIHRAQKAQVRNAQVLRMDVWRDGALKTIDLQLSELGFPLPDGRRMSPDDFIRFLREHCPQLQVGVPVID